MIIQKYATDTFRADGDWSNVYDNWFDVLFDDKVGKAAGFDPKFTNGAYSESGKLMAAVAYSAIDEGTLVFGNTGIRALFNDMNEMGSSDLNALLNSLALSDLELHLAEAVTQYAGLLARLKVDYNAGGRARDPLEGIIDVKENLVSVDLTEVVWDQTASSPSGIFDWIELFADAALRAVQSGTNPNDMILLEEALASVYGDKTA